MNGLQFFSVPKNITDYQSIINKLDKNDGLTKKDLNSLETVFKTWSINLEKLEKSLNTDSIKTDVLNLLIIYKIISF